MTVSAVGLLEGFHKHHIVPKYLGGNDSPENLVLLHPYDYAIAHFVRWKMYGTHGDAWAFNRFANRRAYAGSRNHDLRHAGR